MEIGSTENKTFFPVGVYFRTIDILRKSLYLCYRKSTNFTPYIGEVYEK